jgi:hypothetical protein
LAGSAYRKLPAAAGLAQTRGSVSAFLLIAIISKYESPRDRRPQQAAVCASPENLSKAYRFQAILKKLPGFHNDPEWERLGHILLVRRPCILGLVERMVSRGLRVVWW